MSDTVPTSAPAEGGDADNYDAIIDQLETTGFQSSADHQDSDQDPAEPDEETPEGIPARDTLKVNGKSIDKSYAEIKEMAQKYQATGLKLEKAKKEIEETRTIKAQLTSQQDAVKQLLGVLQRGDLDTIEEFVTEKLGAGDVFKKAIITQALKIYEESKMSPQQREAVENRKLVAKYKADTEARAKQDQEKAFQYEVTQWEQHIALEVPKALTQVGLQDSPFVREQVIQAWRAAIERGQTPTAHAVAAFVKSRLDAAKVNFNAAPTQKAAQRPKATAESVGLKKAGSTEQYQDWNSWLKSRGK